MEQQRADHWHYGLEAVGEAMANHQPMTIAPAQLSKDFLRVDDNISNAHNLVYTNLEGPPLATIPGLVSESQGPDIDMSNTPTFFLYQDCLNDPIVGPSEYVMDYQGNPQPNSTDFQQPHMVYNDETTPKTASGSVPQEFGIADHYTSEVSQMSQPFPDIQNYQINLPSSTITDSGLHDVTKPTIETPKAARQPKNSRRRGKVQFRRSISRATYSPPSSKFPRPSGAIQHASNISDTTEATSSQNMDVRQDFQSFNPTSTLAQRKKTYLIKQMKILADQQAELERQMRALMIDDEMFGGLSDNESADNLERIASSSSSKSSIHNSEAMDSDDTADHTSISSTSRLAAPFTRETSSRAEKSSNAFSKAQEGRERTSKREAPAAEPSQRKHDRCVDCGFKTLYQCTYPGCSHATHSFADFKRHESGDAHWPQNRFMCLKCLPPMADECGNTVCGFCNLAMNPFSDNIEQHSLLCMFARNNAITFGRADHLIEHLRKYHPAEDNNKAKQKEVNKEAATWKYPIDSKWPRQCGFCGVKFQSWEERMKHLAEHFQEGLTIKDWKLPFLPPRDFRPGPSYTSKKDNNDDDDDDNSPSYGRGRPFISSSANRSGRWNTTGQSKEGQNQEPSSHQGQRTRSGRQGEQQGLSSMKASLPINQGENLSVSFRDSYHIDFVDHKSSQPLALQRYLDDPHEPIPTWLTLGTNPTSICPSRERRLVTVWEKQDVLEQKTRLPERSTVDVFFERTVSRRGIGQVRTHTPNPYIEAAGKLMRAYISMVTRKAITPKTNHFCTLSICEKEFHSSDTIGWFAHCLDHPMVHDAFAELLRAGTRSSSEVPNVRKSKYPGWLPDWSVKMNHVATYFQKLSAGLDQRISSPLPPFFEARVWRAHQEQRTSRNSVGMSAHELLGVNLFAINYATTAAMIAGFYDAYTEGLMLLHRGKRDDDDGLSVGSHGDLKPANILLRDQDAFKSSTFQISRLCKPEILQLNFSKQTSRQGYSLNQLKTRHYSHEILPYNPLTSGSHLWRITDFHLQLYPQSSIKNAPLTAALQFSGSLEKIQNERCPHNRHVVAKNVAKAGFKDRGAYPSLETSSQEQSQKAISYERLTELPILFTEAIHTSAYDQRCDKFGRAIERPSGPVLLCDFGFFDCSSGTLSQEESDSLLETPSSGLYPDLECFSPAASLGNKYSKNLTSKVESSRTCHRLKSLISVLGGTDVGKKKSTILDLDGDWFYPGFTYPELDIDSKKSDLGESQFPKMNHAYVDPALIYPECLPTSSTSTPPYIKGSSLRSPFLPTAKDEMYGYISPPSYLSSAAWYGCPSSFYTANPPQGPERSTRLPCSYPECGKTFKDLKAHILTHGIKRPEKCPITTCEYHTKGFARKYDKHRHTLTHYQGTMVCRFCPGAGSAAEKSFDRADVFKRHLTSVHGVMQTPPNSRKRNISPDSKTRVAELTRHVAGRGGKCSTCSATFNDLQIFYDHLDGCVLRVIQHEDPASQMQMDRNSRLVSDTSSNIRLLEGEFSQQRESAEEHLRQNFKAPEVAHGRINPRHDDHAISPQSSKITSPKELTPTTDHWDFSRLMIEINYRPINECALESTSYLPMHSNSGSPNHLEVRNEAIENKLNAHGKYFHQLKNQVISEAQLSTTSSNHSPQSAPLPQNWGYYGNLGIDFAAILSNACESKGRLSRDESAILEASFRTNPKPNTQTKRRYADDMHVDLCRINNWFQNRRAKRKQEKKQAAFEAARDGIDEQEWDQLQLIATRVTATSAFEEPDSGSPLFRASASLLSCLRAAEEDFMFKQSITFYPRLPDFSHIRTTQHNKAPSSQPQPQPQESPKYVVYKGREEGAEKGVRQDSSLMV